MKNEEKKNGNIVECIYRRYRVQSPGGVTIEVESDKPLSGRTTRALLDDDNEIGSFFENHRIIDVTTIKNLPNKPVHKQRAARVQETIRAKRSEVSIDPLGRINHMLQMSDTFTRLDYQKFMQTEHKVPMSAYMGHNDIEAALALKKLESVGRAGRRGHCKYRVIDQTEINEDQYKALLKEQKR